MKLEIRRLRFRWPILQYTVALFAAAQTICYVVYVLGELFTMTVTGAPDGDASATLAAILFGLVITVVLWIVHLGIEHQSHS